MQPARLPLRSLTRLTRLTNPSAQQLPRLFSTTRHRSSALPVSVTGTGTGTLQTLTVPGKPYTFSSDTYPVLGGTDSAPSPVVYSLAALGACNQVTGAVVARDRGIRLGEWRVTVDGMLPTGALVHGEEGADPNWESVKLRVWVQTDLPAEGPQFEAFVSEVERRCPITALFRKSGVRWESEWVNERI